MESQLNNSQKIILLTATKKLSDKGVDCLKKLLDDDLDWHFIKKYSEEHGTAPLLYKSLEKNQLTNFIDPVFYNELKTIYYKTQTINIIALEKLKEVLEIFNQKGIKTVLLKGMAAAEFIYTDLGLRPMGDIDILVENKHLLDAESVLLDMGFIFEKPYKSHTLRTLNIHNHLTPFIYKNIKIEIHRDLSSVHYIHRLPLESIWHNLKEVYINNIPTHIINTPKNLLYLSLHAMQHFHKRKIRLNSFVDIAELIKNEKDEINWTKLINDCKSNGISLPVQNAMEVCKKYLDAPIPNEVFESLGQAEKNINHSFLLLLNNEIEKIPYSAPSSYIKKIKKIDGWGNKFKYLLSEIFPSKEYMVFTYKIKPKNLYFLWYFIQFYKQFRKVVLKKAS